MNWNSHTRDVPEGSHAFLGASSYHWLNYDEEHLKLAYHNHLKKQEGTELHAFAKECIRLKQRLPQTKKTLNLYVNDAIYFKLRPEQPLKYSEFCFGTADAIGLDKKILRVFDLKTGKTPVKVFHQLEIYVALFCLEYDFIPADFDDIILRIYQFDEFIESHPDTEIIVPIMDKIISFDKILYKIKEDEESW